MSRFRALALILVFFVFTGAAHAALTVEPITWNVIGLDSNDPANGPNRFPVGARICSNVATTNVSVSFVWDSANPNINLRPGSLSTINIPSIGAGACADAYFEVAVTPTPAAFDTTRRYHITATDFSGTVSTPSPRELYVEHLISQNRNSISDVRFGTSIPTLASVPPGGSMNMVVGNTYVVQLRGGTATQGYNQFEEFINFSNTVFQILSVQTTYSADNSPYVANPSDELYADACLWDNDPNSPTYRQCIGGDFKAGGTNVVTTYTIRVVSGGGTSEALNALLYDFSGSSFHYNADYSASARIANIIDPSTATISKSFSPNPAPLNGVSALTFTLTNPNAGALSGYNFVDTLPANLIVSNPPAASTTGCGTPTLTAVAGSGSISFSNGTLAANSTCVITVNVTPTATGTLNNTTGNLFIGSIDTGDNASASLTVNTAPPPGTGICNQLLARWNFETGMNVNSPAPTVNNAGTATASAGTGVTAAFSATDNTGTPAGTGSWRSNGAIATGTPLNTTNNDYFQFAIDTTGRSSVTLLFDAYRTNNGPHGVAVYWGTSATPPGTQAFATDNALSTATTWVPLSHTFTTGLNPSGVTYFRIYGYNSSNTNPGADFNIDNVRFTGCGTATAPAIAKSFSPDPIAVNGVSTLTFTLTNSNSAALTGAAFTDALPSGLQVAPVPGATTTCGGTWTPAAGATTLTFSGGTIPASGSCTVSVNIRATTAGAHPNVSGFLSTTESGTTITTVASDTLTAVLPPSIAKQFTPSPVVANRPATIVFTITNPNQDNAISGVAFTDTLPIVPSNMTVAMPPNATTTGCGSPSFSPVTGASSISFTNGTIVGGGTCVVTVDVVAGQPGTYTNTTGSVSHVINAQTINGNTGSDTLVVEATSPGLSFSKQIGPSATGPWTSYLATSGQAWYRFTLENTGDVPLDTLAVTDDTISLGTCASYFASIPSLPVADASDDDHIVTCVVGPFQYPGPTVTNTASASANDNGTPVPSNNDSAIYAVPAITLDKTSAQTSFTIAGDTINYSYLVTNSGGAILDGPVTVADDRTTVTCPALSTIGDLDNFFDPGESITCSASYVTTGTDVANAQVTNTASATVDGVSSNSDSVTVPLSSSADVSIVKTLDTAGPFSAGQSIQYTLLIANAGPSAATNVQVTDTPANLTITSVSGSGCAALPCTIALLASGASTSITVTATINGTGAFDNAATVWAVQPDPDPADNTDDTGNGGLTGASADLSIVKTLDTPPPYIPGQSIQYTLFIANAGPSTATNVQVSDTPSNLTITGVSGSGCAALPCTIASLASGANTSITVTATIDAAGAFDNSASVTATEPDPDPTDNTDNTGNGGSASPSVDVSLVKTLDTPPPYAIGQSIQYTLLISNAGPSAATNVQVTDMPMNLTITSVSGSGCAALPCTIASLASGASTSITVTATIDAAGDFDNSATATPAEPDSNPTNNTDTAGNGGSAPAVADVSIVKTLDTAGPFSAGQSIQYTLLIANAGPSAATDIQVTDTPSNLTITGVSGSGCAALPCTIPSLASGANTSITVTATIDAAGAFDNSATATPAETDPDPSDNTDNSGNGGSAAASVDVSLAKTLDTAGPFNAGQTIQYTLLIANAGPSTATNIQVTDTPANLTITSVSGSGCAALPCTIASLASGANTSIAVTATIDAAGAFDNSATATPSEADANTSNNTDSTGNGGTAAALVDVSLAKTLDTSSPFTVGQTVQYTLLISNAGPSTATNIQVTDTPANLTITGVTGSGCAALPCTIASLASGANTSITVTATINAEGAFDNSATATPAETDANPSNNTDSTGNSGSTTASVDVSLVKTLVTTGPFNAGQSIQYTLLIANAGPSTATNIQVTDTPSNLTITGVSGSGCAALPCTIASLASGANTSITVTATIDAAGAFDNSATATPSEADANTSNNTDSTGNGGTAAASVDVSLAKTLDTSSPFTVGQTVQYTLLISNAGPSTATNIQVTDTPANLTITGVSGSGCAALPCTIASLASGANTSITVTATINAEGAFDNSATATPAETDSNPANNTDSTGNSGSTTASVDVSLVKTLITAGPFSAGQSIQYTLLIANAGPSTATNIQVTDTPSNLTITGVTGSGCAALPCTIASLASGANTSITVTATIDAAGAFDNSATATPSEADANTSNNTDSTGNGGTAAASVDVSLAKTLDTSSPFTVGQTVQYTLLISNAGPSTATNIQVTDTPANLTITGVSGSGCAALPCTIASLASGANTSITVTATINAEGSFDNSATATPAETDSNPANNTDSTGNSGSTTASVDVSLVKTLVTTGPFNAGQSIQYTLLIANAGPSTATNIQVTDTPSNLTITSVTGSGCAALPCTIASLASGANTSITVTATINAAGAFDNSATATPSEADANTSNNTDSTGNGGTAAASVDVSLVKTLDTSSPFTVGQTVQYTLLISNAGPSTATNIQVTDTPANLTITGVSGSGCAALPCTIASLASGANTSITVTAMINAEGAFDNSATATPAETDVNPANNTDSTGNSGSTTASVDVSLVKTLVTTGPFSAGQTIQYTLLIANAGPSTATSIQVTDTPSNLTITSVSGSGCAALPCTIASLASGANTSITVTATIDAAGAFDNSATATPSEADANTSNNTDSTGNGGTAAASVDVSLVKTLDTSSPFTVGQAVQYTLLISNAGPSTATNIQVTDTPANLTITSVSGSGCAALPCAIASLASGANSSITVTATINAEGAFDNSATATPAETDSNPANNTDSTGNSGSTTASVDVSLVKTLITAGPFSAGQSIQYTLSISNAGPSTATNIQVTDTPSNLTITTVSGSGCAALPCTIASLASGANTSITVTATIDAAGAFDNSATATPSEADANTSNNTDSTGNGGTAAASADVSVVKTLDTAGPFSAGQSIQYTLLIANAGPSTATNLQVTDTPANLTITSVSGSGCAALPCTIASLASGVNTSITVTATINAAGAFDNAATVTAAEPDPNPGNNDDSSGNGGNTNTPFADLMVVKTASVPVVQPGDPLTYTIVVTNNGPSMATNVVVTDPLPPSFALTSATSTQGTCTGTTVVTCNAGTMASAAQVTITIAGTVSGTGSLANTATVTATEADPVPNNNSSTATPSLGGNIPTVGEWGLIMMMAMLALAGVVVMKR
jgi:uncharacterized repeat protein (TIGR01451 family)